MRSPSRERVFHVDDPVEPDELQRLPSRGNSGEMSEEPEPSLFGPSDADLIKDMNPSPGEGEGPSRTLNLPLIYPQLPLNLPIGFLQIPFALIDP